MITTGSFNLKILIGIKEKTVLKKHFFTAFNMYLKN